MRRPSRSSLISLIVSMSRLSYWTTTRPGMVARSSGAMSISGAAVMSMPPVWIDRWRGNPAIRPVSSSQRSHGERPTVDVPPNQRARGGLAAALTRSHANGIVTFRISQAISQGWIGWSSRFWFGRGGFERVQGQLWILGGRAVGVREA